MVDPVQILTPRLRLSPINLNLARMLIAGYVPPVPRSVPDYPLDGTLLVAGMLVTAEREGAGFGPFGSYQIVRTTDARVIGDCGFLGPPDGEGIVCVGYELAPSARGMGYATEAVCGLLSWALAREDVTGVVSDCDRADEAGRRVLERAGMRLAGTMDTDFVRYRS